MADSGIAPETHATPPARDERVQALVAEFERIGRESMRGLPFYNEALTVAAIGFERCGDEWLGVLVTPWFMNLMLLSDQPIPYAEAANGKKRVVEFPGGPVKFLCGGTEKFGMFYAHSIASPMDVYRSPEQARAAARLALARLRTPPQAEPAHPPQGDKPPMSRRTLFRFAGRPLSSDSAG